MTVAELVMFDHPLPFQRTSTIKSQFEVMSISKEFIFLSAGIGRTGTFIALEILTDQGETLGYVDPFGCVTTLRNQRVSMVQTKVNKYSLFYK